MSEEDLDTIEDSVYDCITSLQASMRELIGHPINNRPAVQPLAHAVALACSAYFAAVMNEFAMDIEELRGAA